MTKNEKELLVMSAISQNLKNEMTQRGKKRQRCHYDFTHMGEKSAKLLSWPYMT